MRTFFHRVKLLVLRTQEATLGLDFALMEQRSRYLCRLLFVLQVVMEVRTNRMTL